MPEFPPVRLLGPADLKNLMALSTDRGWLPERRKWGLLLDTSEVFGADAPDGRGLAGSVTLTRYGALPDDGSLSRDGALPRDGSLPRNGALPRDGAPPRDGIGHASVGMMLVAARYGRRGLGRTLMTHLLGAAGDATVTLFATAMGRPLYEKLGFKPTGRSVSFTGHFRPGSEEPAITTSPAAESDLPAILALDKAVFGTDRSHILRRLPDFAEEIRVSEDAAGYAAAWSNGQTTVIGPVIAPDGATARRLITDLAATVRGPVRLELDPDRPELPAWAESRGLAASNLNTVMAYGPWDPPGDRSRVFAPITVALT